MEADLENFAPDVMPVKVTIGVRSRAVHVRTERSKRVRLDADVNRSQRAHSD